MLKTVFRLLAKLAVLASVLYLARGVLKRWVDGPDPEPAPAGSSWAPVVDAPRVAPPANPAPPPPAAAQPEGAPAPPAAGSDEPVAGRSPAPNGSAPVRPAAETVEKVEKEPVGSGNAAAPAEAVPQPGGPGPTGTPAERRGRPDRPLKANRPLKADRPLKANRPLKAAGRDAGADGAATAAAGSSGRRKAAPAPSAGPAGTSWVAPDESGAAPSTHPVKAKVGSRTYREPGSSGYERAKPDRCYVSAEAAEADGFVRAKR